MEIMQPGSVIIDHATLRGALIALGLSKPQHINNGERIRVLDSHVVAAESLIETLLLHEHIYVPRLHIEEFSQSVKTLQAIVGPAVLTELPLSDVQSRSIEDFAKKDYKLWTSSDDNAKARLREFAGVEVPVSRWDHWIFQRYLGGTIYHDFFHFIQEISDYRIAELDEQPNVRTLEARIKLLQSKLRNQPTKEQLDAAVLWLTFRTSVYDCVSWCIGVPYVPHPQRASVWKAVNLRRSQPVLFRQLPYDILFDARLMVGNQVNETLGFHLFDLDIPPFFTYVLSKANHPSEILPMTIELRNHRGIRSLRRILQDASETLYDQKSISKLQKLRKDFEKIKHDLTTGYFATPSPKISPSIQLGSVIGASFDAEIPNEVSNLLSQFGTINKPHLAILREIFKVTLDVWELSYLYDRLFKGEFFLSKTTIVKPKSRYFSADTNRTIKEVDDQADEESKLVAPLQCRAKVDEFLSSDHAKHCQLALIDIDDMTKVNEEHGHAVSKRLLHDVLQDIAEIASLVSRVAGDTFIAVMFDSKSEKWIAEIEKKISKLNYGRGKASVSVGRSVSPQDGNTADQLLKIAYRRLQSAKGKKLLRMKPRANF
jgi:diguanylate cyclase (GGDEF)-like protein